MARHDSKQIKQWEALGHSPLKPNELHGRQRIAYFQFQADRDATGAVVAQNDDVRLCQIPAGARLTGGKIKHGAFGSSVTLDIGLRGLDGSGYITTSLSGTADDPDAVATNLDVAAAGVKDLFEEPAYLFYETEKELELYALFEGANPADNVELSGFVEYVVD
jgi:hypothetical protein